MSAFGQTVSNITFDGIGDSSVRVIFNVSASFNAMRVRYGTSTCTSGAGGTVQINGTSPASYMLFGMTTDLSGLAPSTLYHVCPEVSGNGGSTWSTGADATFTTAARTQTFPLAPLAVSTTFPAHGSDGQERAAGLLESASPDQCGRAGRYRFRSAWHRVYRILYDADGAGCDQFHAVECADVDFQDCGRECQLRVKIKRQRLSTALPNCLPGDAALSGRAKLRSRAEGGARAEDTMSTFPTAATFSS